MLKNGLFGLLLFSATVPVLAQGPSVEITPMIGYRWGGELDVDIDGGVFGDDTDIISSPSFGLLVDVPLSHHLDLELLVDHQPTELGDDEIFVAFPTADLDMTCYQIGVRGQWYAGSLRPFVAGGLGITVIDPDIPGLRSDERFSGSFGGGFTADLNRVLAFRLEGRIFWADTGHDGWDDDDWWEDDDHCRSGCDDGLGQASIRVGLVFKL